MSDRVMTSSFPPTPDAQPRGRALHDDHWCVFGVARPNVLLIGQEVDTDLAVASITCWGEEEVGFWPTATAPPIGVSQLMTLVVRNVTDLDWAEQVRLNEWLAELSEGVRVIATSRVPFYTLVTQRRFLEPLYYRLNIVCLNAHDLDAVDG
jgi:hypothetical protein